MKYLAPLIEQALGMLWVSGCVYCWHKFQWDGLGTFIASLPGVLSFVWPQYYKGEKLQR